MLISNDVVSKSAVNYFVKFLFLAWNFFKLSFMKYSYSI